MRINNAELFLPRHQAGTATLRVAQDAVTGGREEREAFLALTVPFQGEPGNHGNPVKMCRVKQRFQLRVIGWGR
ncbi:hypothetical protein GVv1_28610 [Enterobacter pseudoroggenkampii]